MNTYQLRFSIVALLEQTEVAALMESILNPLQKLLVFPGPGVPSFEADGSPSSEEELIACLLEARENVRSGNEIPSAELKTEPLAE
ncbi:MAG: hypothetical protein KAX50_01615 [Saprospiraceae bacterium]|nr:hypothetical protein [Saprospiraceae bacterium]